MNVELESSVVSNFKSLFTLYYKFIILLENGICHEDTVYSSEAILGFVE